MKKQKNIAINGIIAALYVVINTVLGAASFGAIQLRLSNTLYQLVAFNKKYYFGIILGVFIANMFSPLGWYDLVFGVGTSILGLGAAIFINKNIKNQFIKQLVVAISATFFTFLVAIELNLVLNLPFLMTWFTVALGQLGSQILGIILMKVISKRYDLTK
ncbi:QueT transporter family protein [Enterococcus sp. BWB1-3]|uniref:QueT transporter family protein n=1 Tax=Enterococcus sp. BWB1-3 TaxID=2787713 RepID=UPI001922A2E9|nr:QueT transporter family protein [Enterococcus sp. BWB1-3]MBL1228151.1 QueT transporter family protein [Enterococcus sp. BWB1-3]